MLVRVECNDCFRCWECTKQCDLKNLFYLPDQLFFEIIRDTVKVMCGRALADGKSVKDVKEIEKIFTLTLVTSRKKYLEENQKTTS